MLNQREYKVTFVRAWADFFKNIFKFRGYTTRKGFWSVELPIFLITITLATIFISSLFTFAWEVIDSEQALKQFQLITSTNAFGLFDKSLMIEKLGLSGASLVAYEKFVFQSIVFSSYSFVVSLLTLTLHVRRFRDIGFSKKGLIVIFVTRLILSFFRINQFINTIINIIYFVFLFFKSKKFSSNHHSSKLKQFFFAEEENDTFSDVEIE